MNNIDELIKLLKDRALSNGVRLGILIALYYVDSYLTFTDLQRDLEIPKSSLHQHLRILEEEGLIEFKKTITSLGIRTVVRITDKGKVIVRRYLDLIKDLKP
ncbi:MAG: winged helix-turn-helix domain-containing protein [Vulcanisaeta sp.]